jgi:GntR family transcriptional regulator/MocR family aminotransferase
MPESWAISGRDLHLDLGRSGRREVVERALREAVQSGRLPPGTLLPPSRALAGDLGIARNTVAEAYTQLVAEGWLTARQGSGTRVAEHPRPPEPAPPHPVGHPAALPYDLRAGFPDVAAFPHTEWLAAARTALAAAPTSAFGYGHPQGTPELRAALAGYLARTRGVRVTPDRVVVCAGFGQGLWALAAALRRRGARRVGVEAYGLDLHRTILADAGLTPVGLPVGASGAEPTGLDDLDAVLLTPAHQFPLGSALDARRRAAFVRWARSGGVVVEDDYDGEFRYDRRPLGAMQALAPDEVVYGGTASKALAPAVGLAWLVPPARLVAPVVAELAGVGARAAVLDQLTLAAFLTSGRYDRHVRRSRLAYRQRRDRLTAAIDATGLRVHGLPAGLHAVVDLPVGRTEDEAVASARRRGLAVQGLAAFARSSPGDRPPALVVGYATPPAHAFTTALARLTATLRTDGGPAAPQPL